MKKKKQAEDLMIYGLALLVIAAATCIIAADALLPKHISKPDVAKPIVQQQNVGIVPAPDSDRDELFARGFPETGLTWPVADEHISASNELCQMRAQYCTRVNYKYANFGCDCFVYQFHESFETFIDNAAGLTLNYPKLWHISQKTNSLVTDTKLSLEREAAKCNITYGKVNEAAVMAMPGVSSTPKTIKYENIAWLELPFAASISDEAKASGYTSINSVVVPHFPYADSEFGLVLTSYTQQPLVEACLSEFESILEGREVDYPSITLSTSTAGTLYIEDIIDWYDNQAGSSEIATRFLFDDEQGKESAVAGKAFREVREIVDPFLYKNTLYYINGNRLFAFDLFGTEPKQVRLELRNDEPIHAFHVQDNFVYFLAGASCNEYMMKCNLDLYRFDMTTERTEKLAAGLTSREIDGLNADKNIVYMNWTEGDAGCMWSEHESFNLISKKKEKLGKYSYCNDGTDNMPANPYAELAKNIDIADRLTIKNGEISLPTSSFTPPYRGNLIRVNTSN